MATERDLINAVRHSLETDGALGRFKAEMRTEVMRLLDGPSKLNQKINIESPRNVKLINELIREYLDWMGYKYTSSVLISERSIWGFTECNLPKQPLDRSSLLQNLGVRDNETTKEIPLLFSLVETTNTLNNSTVDKFAQ